MLSLIACQQQSFLQPEGSDAQGEVEIALSAVGRTQLTKATTEDLPDVADFTVDILTSDGSESLYENSYSKMAGRTLYLNTGDYLLNAFCGDSLGVGFDAAFFAASEPFTVEWQQKTEISAVAKMANVKAAVVYGENLQTDYAEEGYYAIVRARQDKSLQIKFAQDETRAGYLPTGNLTFELYVVIDGALKYYQYDAGDFEANDFVTFKVDTEHGEGFVTIDITIDKETDLVEEEVEVPYTMLPKDEPTISFTGLVSETSIEVVEGVEPSIDELRANLVAYGEFEHVYVNIDSDYLANLGIPDQVDLVDIDDETAALLREQGFSWTNPTGHTLAYVDFYGIVEKLYGEHYSASNPFVLNFSVTVIDTVGNEVSSDTYTITNAAPEFTVSVRDYDIWGWKITAETVTVTKGNSDLVTLQYSDGEQWHDVERVTATTSSTGRAKTLSTGDVTFSQIAGLTAGTDYVLRGVYNGDTDNAVEYDLTTEDPQQPGNADMEEWTTLDHTYTHNASSEHHMDYWQPYAVNETDPWWADNGEKSMRDNKDSWTVEWCKVFPCAGPSVDTPSGEGYSAHVITVNTGGGNSATIHDGTTHIGELFIGTVGSQGAHETEGHSFGSRPAKIAFDYKYIPHTVGEEFFVVEVDVYADESAETLIGSYSTSAGPSSADWTSFEADVNYSVTDQKAAWIYISIKASNGSTGVNTGASVEFNGEDLTAHMGSSLRIDNIRLIYEE